MKKLLAVVVLCLGLSGVATAEEKTYTFQEFGHSVSQIPVKVGNHISNEIEKTKEYQKASWAKMKVQLSNLFNKFSSSK